MVKKKVTVENCFDNFPLTLTDSGIRVSGLNLSDRDTIMPVGWVIHNIRIYSTNLTLDERIENFKIDSHRFYSYFM